MSSDAYMQAVNEALAARDALSELEAELAASGKDDRDLKLRVRAARQEFRLRHRHNIPTLPGDGIAQAQMR